MVVIILYSSQLYEQLISYVQVCLLCLVQLCIILCAKYSGIIFCIIGSLFYNLYNRHCENNLMIFIELHMHSSSEHAHIVNLIVSPINVETTFFVLKFVIFAAEINLIPFLVLYNL